MTSNSEKERVEGPYNLVGRKTVALYSVAMVFYAAVIISAVLMYSRVIAFSVSPIPVGLRRLQTNEYQAPFGKNECIVFEEIEYEVRLSIFTVTTFRIDAYKQPLPTPNIK